jgi:pimeloyl-ACP methyl ester carboxylesterase
VIEALAKHFTVYVPDLVGMGDSDKPDRPYHAPRLARWIADFQRAVGIRGSDVIGNSLGGYLSMWLALEDPEAIGRAGEPALAGHAARPSPCASPGDEAADRRARFARDGASVTARVDPAQRPLLR